jgi:hypothetical protein
MAVEAPEVADGAVLGVREVRFFIPAAKDASEAETVYQSIRDHVSKVKGADLSAVRIFKIVHSTEGKTYVAAVGSVHGFANNEKVVAILFEPMRKIYHVCTPNRGVVRDGPIMVGAHEVEHVELFETEEGQQDN